MTDDIEARVVEVLDKALDRALTAAANYEGLDADAGITDYQVSGNLLDARPASMPEGIVAHVAAVLADAGLLAVETPEWFDALDRAKKAEAELADERIYREAAEATYRAQLKKAEAALAEVCRTSRVLPCDGLCSEYPEEDCSLHGREPAELWEAIAEKNGQADAERARAEKAEQQHAALVARIEALADGECTLDYCEPDPDSVCFGGRIRAALRGDGEATT